jgi:hypothetical protein
MQLTSFANLDENDVHTDQESFLEFKILLPRLQRFLQSSAEANSAQKKADRQFLLHGHAKP